MPLIWDLPTRLFHWLFAGGFIAAAVLALTLDDEHRLFPYHGLIGLTLGLMVALRLIWGIVGTRHARFANFAFGPGAVARYLRAELLGPGERHAGHNPGSAYAIFAMLALTIGLVVTGVMMGTGVRGIKNLHELLAYAMLGVIAAHVLGVIVYTLRFREIIALSMITGRKRAPTDSAIASPKPVVAGVFLLVTAAWAVALVRGFDPATARTTLPLVGTSIRLGEPAEGRERAAEPREREHDAD
jgi:cytochrome b